MECVASTLLTTSEHGVSSIATAGAHDSAASSRLNWRPWRFKWTRPFRRKTKSGVCARAITFPLASTTDSSYAKANKAILPESYFLRFLSFALIGNYALMNTGGSTWYSIPQRINGLLRGFFCYVIALTCISERGMKFVNYFICLTPLPH